MVFARPSPHLNELSRVGKNDVLGLIDGNDDGRAAWALHQASSACSIFWNRSFGDWGATPGAKPRDRLDGEHLLVPGLVLGIPGPPVEPRDDPPEQPQPGSLAPALRVAVAGIQARPFQGQARGTGENEPEREEKDRSPKHPHSHESSLHPRSNEGADVTVRAAPLLTRVDDAEAIAFGIGQDHVVCVRWSLVPVHLGGPEGNQTFDFFGLVLCV
jgi:hypothetical protein